MQKGRRVALLIAGLGLGWIAVTALGATFDWPQRVRALFDLAILAGFGMALWLVYGLWRDSQAEKDRAQPPRKHKDPGRTSRKSKAPGRAPRKRKD